MMTIPENDRIEATINMAEDAVYIELRPMEEGVDFQVHGLNPGAEVMALSAGILYLLVNEPDIINKAITDYMDEVQKAEKVEQEDIMYSPDTENIEDEPRSGIQEKP
jgi:hypothetical protein